MTHHFRFSRLLAPGFVILVWAWLSFGISPNATVVAVVFRWAWFLLMLGIFLKELWQWYRTK